MTSDSDPTTNYKHDLSEWNDLPKCPKCGTDEHDWWDSKLLRNDGDETSFNCGSCGTDYKVSMCVSTSFRTWKDESLDEPK
jgi:DNA-directed RNA polymerase subunit M/transcription elongation factor TFIIS